MIVRTDVGIVQVLACPDGLERPCRAVDPYQRAEHAIRWLGEIRERRARVSLIGRASAAWRSAPSWSAPGQAVH
jgi:hypothetical protein